MSKEKFRVDKNDSNHYPYDKLFVAELIVYPGDKEDQLAISMEIEDVVLLHKQLTALLAGYWTGR